MKTVLFLKTNPIDSKDLRLENEERDIIRVWEQATNRDDFEVISRGALNKDDLTTHLNQHKPKFVHISGHADEERNLFLEDMDGYKEEVPIDRLINLLENFEHINVLFLNTCHSLNNISTLDSSINYIIGMIDKVPNNYAVTFSREFYKNIFSGSDVKKSFDIALDVLDLRQIAKDHIPRLYINEESIELVREENALQYPLVSDGEINKAKDNQIKLKKIFQYVLSFIVVIFIGLITVLLIKSEFALTLEILPAVLPLVVGSYPVLEIVKRTERISLIELFELKLERFRSAYKWLAKDDVLLLNAEFQSIIKL